MCGFTHYNGLLVTPEIEGSMFNLRKVDFIWINRDQKSFEWFVDLL